MSAKLKMAVVLGSAALCGLFIASAHAELTSEDANPYSIISDKNVFHLNPPPPPPSAQKEKPPELPKVMLSGFQKIGDQMEVFLALPAKDPKDNAYLALKAGEKERDVEIVSIRAKKQEVDIINTGTPMTLSISNNGFALGGGAPAPGPGPGGKGGPPTPGGFGNRRIPVLPPAATAAAAAPANGDNSAIIVGSSGNVMQNLGNYTGGAIISGNEAPAMAMGGAAPNNPAAQIANTLLNGANTGQNYRMPTPQAPPEPLEVQAAGLLIHEANGGPPAPPGIADQ